MSAWGQFVPPSGGGGSPPTTNAGDLTTGTLDDARLSVNVNLAGNTFNGEDDLVQLAEGGPTSRLWKSTVTDPSVTLNAVCYCQSLDLYVAVGNNCVMTSPDGINWTPQTPAAANNWTCVIYFGKFVALSSDGSDQCMTSPDGEVWTSSSTPGGTWEHLCMASGSRLVAVSSTAQTVMTSTDGLSWNAYSASANKAWKNVFWSENMNGAQGNGLTAVAADGLMTSDDLGETWTNRSYDTSITLKCGFCPGTPQIAVIIGIGGDGVGCVMTSDDRFNWTTRATPVKDIDFNGITFSFGLLSRFVAVGPDAVMWSANGLTWTVANIQDGEWESVVPSYTGDRLVAVASSGDHRAITATEAGSLPNFELDATNLVKGTIPDARFPAILPAKNGSLLTNLPPATNLLISRKAFNQTITDDTNLTADESMYLPIISGVKYLFKIVYYFATVATSGIQLDLNGGDAGISSIQGDILITDMDTGGVLASGEIDALADVTGLTVTGTKTKAVLEGSLVCNFSGNFIPRFAQNTETGVGESVIGKIGSFMKLTAVP